MAWLLLALIPQISWSLSNIFDQILVRKFSASSTRSYFVIAGLSYIPFLIGFLFFAPNLFEMPFGTMAQLLAIGFLNPTFVWFYIKALQQDNASMVVPIFQTIPIFVFIMGFVFLGETLSIQAMIGGLVIISAATMIVWDFKKAKFQWKTFSLMLMASFLFAVLSIFLRAYAEIDWYIIAFWQVVAWFITAMILLCICKNLAHEIYRQSIDTKGAPYCYSIAQSGTDLIAISAFTAALAIAPSAVLVTLIGGLQPIIIIVFAAISYYVWPVIFDKPKKDKSMALKLTCATAMFVGLYLIVI